MATAAPAIRSTTRQYSLSILRPLALWHLLSLDAPSVAALWTWFAARTVGVHLPLAAPLAMFISVWMLYAADRLLDSTHSTDLEARHHFHRRHSTAFFTGIIAGSVALVTLSHFIYPEAVCLYALLGGMLFAWFILIHARRGPRRLPKEIAVGLFFPAAVFIPTVARDPALRIVLVPHAILFAAVCSLNCLFIYAWEHPGTRPHAHWTTRLATRHLPLLVILVFAASVILASISYAHGPWQLASACAASALALLVLHQSRHRIGSTTLRAASDAVLLTPLLLLLS